MRFQRTNVVHVAAIALAPVIVVGLLALACARQGVLTASGCEPWVVFGTLDGDRGGPACNSVPFLVDIPSVTLAVTSSLAVVIYLVFVRRLRRLVTDLEATGLLNPEELRQRPMARHITSMRKWLAVPAAAQAGGMVFVLGVGVVFYWWVLNNNHLFHDIPSAQNSGPVSDEVLVAIRDAWWADWDTHPGLATTWIVVGSLGAYFPLRQAYLCLHLAKILKITATLAVLNYVPPRLDRDYGWRPFGQIIALSYVSGINFIVSFIALLYILRSSAEGSVLNYGLAVFAILGVVINVRFVLALILSVRRAHQLVIDTELLDANKRLAQLPAAQHDVNQRILTIQADHIANAPRYPIRGKAVRVVSLLPGLIAGGKLVLDAIGLLAG